MSVAIRAVRYAFVAFAAVFTLVADGLAATATALIPTQAPIGARVLVVGSGLDAPDVTVVMTAVTGIVAAPVVARSANSVEVIVPAGATSGLVHVRVNGAEAATLSFRVADAAPYVAVRSVVAAARTHDVLKQPNGVGIVFPSGALCVADTANHRVLRIDATGAVTVIGGTGAPGYVNGAAAQAQFKQPHGVVFDAARAIFYVADTGNHVIRTVTTTGVVGTLAGSGRPADSDGSGSQAAFQSPTGLALDVTGNVYVADTGNNKVKRVTPAGVVATIAGTGLVGLADGPAAQALFNHPEAVAVTRAGAVYVADTKNHVIRRIENATVTTAAGTRHPALVDGSAAVAEFNEPAGITLDDAENVFVADRMNDAVRRLSAGVVMTIAGSGKGGYVDGAAAVALFNRPAGIASAGALFVSDVQNDAVRMVVPALTVLDVYPRTGDVDGGTAVRVFGTGFIPGQTTVTFGGTPAAVTYIDSSELMATSPAGAIGSVDVAVTTAAGTATLRDGFRYEPPFTSLRISPSAATIERDKTLQLSAFGVGREGAQTDLTSRAAWASNAPEIATVSAGGLLTAVAPGTATITASFGTTLTATINVTVVPPKPPFTAIELSPASATLAPAQTIRLVAYGVADGSKTDITTRVGWTAQQPAIATVDLSGVVTAVAPGRTTITAALGALSRSATITVAAPPPPPPPPPDPLASATPIDATAAASFIDDLRFLYTGANAVQTGVAANVIRDDRATVLRGRVFNVAGQPFRGVRVTAVGRPELGETVTRADGMYDFVVNGGDGIVLRFERTGYLVAQRLVTSQWNEQKNLPNVTLVALDPLANAVTLNAPAAQAARGSRVSDDFGSRQATIVIPAGTGATIVRADGSSQAVGALTIRATEFTVGASGPSAMPAELPPASGYTYCVELSADEAPADADVRFTKPLAVYVENFLGFPVGSAVPVGYYDRTRGVWAASENGVVVKVLSVTDALADLDTNGDGVSDAAATLTALGIDDAERQRVATLYTAGQSLWRVAVTHFTPWDCNWPTAPPLDAIGPSLSRPSTSRRVSKSCKSRGSIIDCENQTLGESIPIVGTPYALEYDSGRTASTRYQAIIPLTGAVVPASMKRVELTVDIAGQRFKQSFAPAANLSYTYTWDGRDGYGRNVQGERDATITIGYVYPAVFQQPNSSSRRSFGVPTTTSVTFSGNESPASGRGEFTITVVDEVQLGHIDTLRTGFAGWTFSGQRLYDSVARALYGPAGEQESGDPDGTGALVLKHAAGNGSCCNVGLGGQAVNAGLNFPISVAPAPDGSFYFSDPSSIYKVDTAGILTRYAGSGSSGFTPDGAGALGSPLSAFNVRVGLDGTVYFNDKRNYRVRKIVNGALVTVAGTGIEALNGEGDNGPATAARIQPMDFAIAPDGTLYILETNRVRRVSTDGVITTYAGPGTSYAENIIATQSAINGQGIAVGPDGSVYVSDGASVRRIATDGRIRTVAGSHTSTRAVGNGELATAGTLQDAYGISVAADSTLVIADRRANRIRAVASNGIITTLAGTGQSTLQISPNGSLARATETSFPYDVKLGADGRVYITNYNNNVIDRSQPIMPAVGKNKTIVPDPSGRVAYVFDAGRHAQTVDLMTGIVLETLAYDTNGYLSSVTDADGNATRIERDGARVTAVVAPGGQRTAVSVGADDRIKTIADPAGNTHSFSYNAAGLLGTMTDPRGGAHKFTYDENSFLVRDEEPTGAATALTRSGNDDDLTVTRKTAEGRVFIHHLRVGLDLAVQRELTTPDGLTVRTVATAATSETNHPDGTRQSATAAPDPRFFMQAPVLSRGTISSGGRTLQLAFGRDVTLGDASDILAPSLMRDTLSVNGRTWITTYERATRTVKSTSPTGRSSETALDTRGHVISSRASGFAASTFSYDGTGQLTAAAIGSRVTRFTYTPQRYVGSVTDILGRTTSFEYDAAGHPLRQVLPDGRAVAFAYDEAGNLTSLTPPSRAPHTFSYDAVDLQVAYAPPAGATDIATKYGYNADRQVTSITRPGAVAINFLYDDAARLASIVSPRGTYAYGYDAVGHLSTISASDGQALEFGYSGALLTSTTWKGEVSGTVAMSYDNDFRTSAETVNGSAVNYGYDADGLLVSAGALALARNAQTGLVAQAQVGDVSAAFQYNEFGEVVQHTESWRGAAFYDATYVRDDVGRVVQQTEVIGGQPVTASYTYDGAGRLTTVMRADRVTRYGYDSNSNRTSIEDGALTTSGTYDAQDRLTAYGSSTFSYTPNGELESKTDANGTTRYEYDVFGALRRVSLPDGRTIDYVIDAEHRRVGKKVAGVLSQRWLYGIGGRIVAELDGSGAVLSRFVYGTRPNVPEYIVRSGVSYRVICDNVGSPRMIVNTTDSAVVQQVEYDEFGRVLFDSNPGFQPFGFAGGLWDSDTGFVRFGARDYDPQTGRWTTRDAILFDGHDSNLYGYVFGDPINLFDPDGEEGLRSAYGTTDGTVTRVGWQDANDHNAGAGWRVTITHPDGSFETYGHMDPTTTVAVGTQVHPGTYIGDYADPTNGHSSGPHLHHQLNDPSGEKVPPGTCPLATWKYKVQQTSKFGAVDKMHPVGHGGNDWKALHAWPNQLAIPK